MVPPAYESSGQESGSLSPFSWIMRTFPRYALLTLLLGVGGTSSRQSFGAFASKTDSNGAPPQQSEQETGPPSWGPPNNLGFGVIRSSSPNHTKSQIIWWSPTGLRAAPPDGWWTPLIRV
jgi:hypothetical protein